MSVPYYGDFAEDDTVNIPFNTFSSDDPSASVTITDLADADIKVHKDAHVDQIVTDGATVVINFDGITGNHMINIDTSVDAAYVTGSEYQVRIEGTTVDGATINAWVGSFSIERAGGALALAKLIQAAVITNAAGVDIAADIIEIKAETATIVNDTDVIDDGTSGLVKIASDVAAILTDTGTDGVVLATGAISAAKIQTDAISADALATDAVTEIANGAAFANGACQAGSTYTTIKLAAAELSTDNIFNGCLVTVVSGTAIGQARLIADYDGGTKIAAVQDPWVTAPASGDLYRIYPFSGILLANTGLPQAVGASTITLATTASAIADTYIGHTIFICGGTGIGQARLITAYTATRIATVSPAWTTEPNTSSVYKLLPVGRTYVSSIADGSISAAAIADAAIDIATFAADCKTGSLLNAHVKGQDDIDFGALQKASINAECDTALTDYDPPTKAEMDTAHATTDALVTTVDGVVDAILADTGTDGVVVAAASKSGYALSNAGIDALWDRASALTVSFETLVTRIYQLLNNELKVTDADGSAVLEPIGGGVDIATGSITDDATTTTRAEWSWT